MRPRDMTALAILAARHPHGTRVLYIAGCRCMLCRAANSRYSCAREKASKNGDWNGIIPAVRAQAHLKMLAQKGIGRRLVERISGIGNSTLQAVKNGQKKNIRARTERRILAVGENARAGRTLVRAAPVWAQLNRLLREGFTQTELARRLGSRAKVPALQLNGRVVTARNAMRVQRLYAVIMAGSGLSLHAHLHPVAQRHRSA